MVTRAFRQPTIHKAVCEEDDVQTRGEGSHEIAEASQEAPEHHSHTRPPPHDDPAGDGPRKHVDGGVGRVNPASLPSTLAEGVQELDEEDAE